MKRIDLSELQHSNCMGGGLFNILNTALDADWTDHVKTVNTDSFFVGRDVVRKSLKIGANVDSDYDGKLRRPSNGDRPAPTQYRNKRRTDQMHSIQSGMAPRPIIAAFWTRWRGAIVDRLARSCSCHWCGISQETSLTGSRFHVIADLT